MNINRILAKLKKERQRIDKAIAALEKMGGAAANKRRTRPKEKATMTSRDVRGAVPLQDTGDAQIISFPRRAKRVG